LGTAEEIVLVQRVWRPYALGAKTSGARWNREGEGNEAPRGGEMSEPLRSTAEAGELTPGDPVEGRRRSVYGPSGGTDATDIGP
jgi:hypothetical protein